MPLVIPWFRLEPLHVPLLWLVLIVLAACVVAAARTEWRRSALQNALFVGAAAAAAFLAGVTEVPIQPFGVFVVLCIVAGTRLALWYAAENDIRDETLRDFAAHITFFGLLFAGVLNAVFYETEDLLALLQDPIANAKWMGLSSYGGFIGAMVGVWVWRVRRALPAWPLADAVAFAFPLAWVFGRLGCFVVHDHPGAATDFFLAVNNYDLGGVARHDLGLYGAIYGAVILVVFLVIRWKWPAPQRPMGLWVALMPLLYTPGRFALDFLRIRDAAGADVRFGGLTPAQYASIGLFVVALGLLAHIRRHPSWTIPSRMRRSAAVPSAGEKPGKSS